MSTTNAPPTTGAKMGAAMSKAADKVKAAGQSVQKLTETLLNPEGSPAVVRWVGWIGLALVALFCVYAIQAVFRIQAKMSTPKNVQSVMATQKTLLDDAFASRYKPKSSLYPMRQYTDISGNQDCLVNFSPLTVMHPGFLGPEKDGVFDVRDGVARALKLGARSLILPIDMHNSDTLGKEFPAPQVPCLLYRDKGGYIRSINGGSIRDAAQTIADLAWSNTTFFGSTGTDPKNDPFILVLYFLRTPPINTQEYLKFMAKVAEEISPLDTRSMNTLSAEGYFSRQAQEATLLSLPIAQLERKVLIFCNADLSLFRTPETVSLSRFPTRQDLDYKVNLRLYKSNPSASDLGVTGSAQDTPAQGLLEKIEFYTTLPPDGVPNAIKTTRYNWVIAINPDFSNTDVTTAKTLFERFGVQSVPILLTKGDDTEKGLLDLWSKQWKLKPAQLRATRTTVQASQQTSTVNVSPFIQIT
jgi:hypothetical protein